jgi:HD superfamily phosphohydrolase
MRIRDPIYKLITLDDVETRILNDPHMQKLYHISQLGLTYLVYPSGMHTRLEHSIGTMHLTREISTKIYEDKMPELEYAGLLHDIGHGPFSHQTESIMKKYLHKNHEQVGKEIIEKSEIKDIINDSGNSIDKVMSYFNGGEAYAVVGSIFGSDRLDYLVRDSYHLGVAYGIIDCPRLVDNLVLKDNNLVIYEHTIAEAESVLIARYFMYMNVYMHHTVIIAEGMLQRALEKAIELQEFNPEELLEINDNTLLYKLTSTKSSELIKKIEQRKLFKRIYYKKINEKINSDEIEDELSKAGLDKDEYIVRFVGMRDKEKESIKIIDNKKNNIGDLSELSPFIKTLEDVLKKDKKLLIACDESKIEMAKKVISNLLPD